MTLISDATLELFRSYQSAAQRDIELGNRPAAYSCEVEFGQPCSHLFAEDVATEGVGAAVKKLSERCPYGPFHVLRILARSSLTAIGSELGITHLKEVEPEDEDSIKISNNAVTFHEKGGATLTIPC